MARPAGAGGTCRSLAAREAIRATPRSVASVSRASRTGRPARSAWILRNGGRRARGPDRTRCAFRGSVSDPASRISVTRCAIPIKAASTSSSGPAAIHPGKQRPSPGIPVGRPQSGEGRNEQRCLRWPPDRFNGSPAAQDRRQARAADPPPHGIQGRAGGIDRPLDIELPSLVGPGRQQQSCRTDPLALPGPQREGPRSIVNKDGTLGAVEIEGGRGRLLVPRDSTHGHAPAPHRDLPPVRDARLDPRKAS